MESKRKYIIKIFTYLVFFLLVGMSLGVTASEFTMVGALNSPVVNYASAETEVTYHSFWLLIAGLVGFIAMTQRKGI
jgi:hypothetical protein